MADGPRCSKGRVVKDVVSSSGRVILASAADEDFAMPLAVMLKSAEMNLREGCRIEAYILDGGLSLDSKLRLRTSLRRSRVRLHWIKPVEGALRELPLRVHLTVATYYRLQVPELLPAHCSKAIYLDADTVVLGDLAELWEHDFAGCPLLAVRDGDATVSTSGLLRQFRGSGVSPDSPCLNAGVLVMDLDVWRREGMAARIIEHVKVNREHVALCDQDGINVVLAGRWRMLDRRWNYGVNLCTPYESDPQRDREVMACIEAGAAIVHFIAAVKPWAGGVTHPAATLFFKYLAHTGWRHWTHERPDVRVIPRRHEVRRFLRRTLLFRTSRSDCRTMTRRRPSAMV